MAPRKDMGIVWTATARGGTSRSHTSNIVPAARLAERLWCPKSQSSLLNIYFRLSGFQAQTSHCLLPWQGECTKVWHKTYPICVNRIRFRADRKTPAQQSGTCFGLWLQRKIYFNKIFSGCITSKSKNLPPRPTQYVGQCESSMEL